ncbi:MAG: hypothetical protein HOQ24_04025 [Mycobacteriaceae bacterium]|nr:hypothetical protein [Mycobacteriaceae bacterium]
MRAVRVMFSAMALLVVAGAVAAGPADAESQGGVYFRNGPVDCVIADNGAVGCAFHPPTRLSWWPIEFAMLPVPFPVDDVVIDTPWLPPHPGGAAAARTRPGGNPDIAAVADSRRMLPGLLSHPRCQGAKPERMCYEFTISHAGSSCQLSTSSLACYAMGRRFMGSAGNIIGH